MFSHYFYYLLINSVGTKLYVIINLSVNSNGLLPVDLIFVDSHGVIIRITFLNKSFEAFAWTLIINSY